MVFCETHISPNERRGRLISEAQNLSKKRKWEDREPQSEEIVDNSSRPVLDRFELHLETPLPSEWQRCLDIQSGEIHFYNTRTHERTCRDPRSTDNDLARSSPCGHMSLDLELNLTCESIGSKEDINHAADHDKHVISSTDNSPHATSTNLFVDSSRSCTKKLTRSPSWLGFDQQEMLATVCMKCHLLVMLCKSSPSCPNCKFMHPPDHTLQPFLHKALA